MATTKNVLLLAVAVPFMAFNSSSCTDTTALGGVEEIYMPEKPGQTITQMAETNFEAEFATDTAKLYTVRQYVEGKIVTLSEDETIMEEKEFKKDLDLNALFERPAVVYVSSKDMLSKVEKTEETEGKADVARVNDGKFVRNVLTRDYKSSFNAGEEISAATMYEKFAWQDTVEQDLCFTAIRSVMFKNAKADLNTKLSNTDSTVYDVVLTYDVELNKNTLTKKDNLETYAVEVPYLRVYKEGDHKVADRVDEDGIKREIVETEDGLVERFTIPTYEEWSETDRKNEKDETLEVPIEFNNPEKQWVITTNADYDTKANGKVEGSESTRTEGYWTIKTKPFTYSSTAENGVTPFDNVYTGSSSAVTFKKGDITISFDYGTWNFKEGRTTIDGPKDVEYKGVTYNGYDYDNNISWTYSIKADKYVSGKTEVQKPGLSEAVILIAKVPDTKVADKIGDVKREIISDEWGIKERFTVTTFEEWRDAGKQNEKTETFEIPVTFDGPEMKWVITSNAKYQTTPKGKADQKETSETKGRWTVETTPFTYSSRADNNANPFENVYTGESSSVTYQKDTLIITFPYGKWSFHEDETTIVGPKDVVRDGVTYDCYNYTNNISWTYSIESDPYSVRGKDKISSPALSEARILIKKTAATKTLDVIESVKREVVNSTTERITITTSEEWSDGSKRNEETFTKDFTISLSAPAKSTVYTTSSAYETNAQGKDNGTESSRTDGNWTIKTKSFSYSSKADNGVDPFYNTYEGSSCSIVFKKGDITLEFPYGTWNVEEGKTNITGPSSVTRNNTNYDAYDYENNISWTYTISGQYVTGNNKASGSLKAEKEILIKKGQQDDDKEKDNPTKTGEHVKDVTREVVDETTERLTVTTEEDWSDGSKRPGKTYTKDLTISFTAPSKTKVYASSSAYQTTGNEIVYGSESAPRTEDTYWTIKTKSFTYTSTARNGYSSEDFTNTYTGSSSSATFEKDGMKAEFPYGSWKITEGSSPVSGPHASSEADYESYDYTNNISWTYSVEGSSKTANAKAEKEILIKKKVEVKDELTGKKAQNVEHKILDGTRDEFTWDEVETWSVSGDKVNKKSWVRYRHFEPAGKQTVYTTNTSYTTSAKGSSVLREVESLSNNVTVKTRYMEYRATSSNNAHPFDNVYYYDDQSGVYKDPDGMYELTFEYPEWDIKETTATVNGTSSRSGNYDVYGHTHGVSYTYTARGNKWTGTAQALADIYILNVQKDIPAEWGEVVSFGVTAVPADDVSGKYAKKAFCLVTTKGAVAVVTDMNVDLPTIDQITKGHFVEGSFSGYDSAFYTTSVNQNGLGVGIWAPAVASDEKGVTYRYNGKAVRHVSTTDLHIWGWRSGNYTVSINGYSVTNDGGILNIAGPNGSTMSIH